MFYGCICLFILMLCFIRTEMTPERNYDNNTESTQPSRIFQTNQSSLFYQSNRNPIITKSKNSSIKSIVDGDIDFSFVNRSGQNLPWDHFITAGNNDNSQYLSILAKTQRLTNGRVVFATCRDRCGIRSLYEEHCSCLPSCYFYKTCCYDFFHLCGHEYTQDNFTQSDYSWLEDANMECLDQFQVVSSCRNDDLNVNSNSSDLSEKLENLLLSLISTEENRKLSMGAGMGDNAYLDQSHNDTFTITSVEDFLRLLNLMHTSLKTNSIQSSPFYSRLLSWPIVDKKTGIIYRNISIYDCNLADSKSLAPLNVIWHVLSTPYLSSNEPKSINDIIPLLSTHHYVQRTNVYNLEGCFPSHFVSKCPIGFVSKDLIEEACETINMPVVKSDRNGNEDISGRQTFYKNPFCFICHEGLASMNDIETLEIFHRKLAFHPYKDNVMLSLNFDNGIFEVVSPFYSNSKPAWKSLSCTFEIEKGLLRHVDGEKGDNVRTNSTTRSSRAEDEHNSEKASQAHAPIRRLIDHECQVVHCSKSKIRHPCYFTKTLVLLLPPSVDVTTSTFLEQWMKVFRKKLNPFIPRQVPLPPDASGCTQKVVYGSVTLKDIHFTIGVQINIYLDSYLLEMDWTCVAEALLESGYPGLKDDFHFCAKIENVEYFDPFFDQSCFTFNSKTHQLRQITDIWDAPSSGMDRKFGFQFLLIVISSPLVFIEVKL